MAIWWAVFSIPLFLKVPEPPAAGPEHGGLAIGAAFSRLGADLQGGPPLSQRVPAVHRDAALPGRHPDRSSAWPSVYGAEVGIEQNAQIAAFVMVQFVGIPFAFLFGSLGTRIGTKRCIFIAIGVYVAGDEPRLLHDQRDALLRAGVPDRHGAWAARRRSAARCSRG